MNTLNQFGGFAPLLAGQMAMWLGVQFASPDTNFNLAEAIDIDGEVDPALFAEAVRQVTLEVEATRLNFVDAGQGPRQVLAPVFNGDLPFLDFSGAVDPHAEAQAWMHADFSRTIDLANGQLWLCALIRIRPGRHVFYQRGHHILLDGFGGGLVARRIAHLYTALAQGDAADPRGRLAPLAQLAEEEHAYRASGRFPRDRQYWRDRFADVPAPLTLASHQSANKGGLLRQTVHLPATSVQSLQSIAQTWGSTLPQMLIALTAAYLYRSTGVEDMVIGIPVTARHNDRMRQVPAMVANALPLRLAMRADLSFAELVLEVGRQMRQILRHQCYRYETLRSDLNLLLNHRQLFTTVVNVEPFDYDFRFAGHAATPRNLSNGTAEDLGIFLYERGNGKDLQIDFDANPALYTAQALADHQQRLLTLIAAVIQQPDQSVGRVELLTAQERWQLLAGWNDTRHSVSDVHLAESIEAGLLADPQGIALRYEEQALSRSQLDRQANRLAHLLRARGAGPERVVALAIPRSLELVVALLAILKTGAAYLPVDPDFPQDRIAFMLGDAQPVCLITTQALAPTLPTAVSLVVLDSLETHSELGRLPDTKPSPLARLHTAQPAYVIYTSGSTGNPKGVAVSHRAIVNRLRWMQHRYGLQADDRVLQKTPSSFDVSVWEFFWPLIDGATLVLAKPGGHKDPTYLAELIVREGITTAHFVPSMLEVFLLEPAASRCSSLRRVICSGEGLSSALQRRFQQQLGCELHNLYGPTEAAVDVTAWECARALPADLAADGVPIGRPIWNTQMLVLDSGLQPLPVGVTGELYIAGMGLARGYLDRPVLSAERFVADPHGEPGTRMYRTGDLARWRADGSLDFLGRADHQVKIRGLRIEPGEIESALLQHPHVVQAAVIAREDVVGEKRLVAYVVMAGGEALIADELRSHLALSLPDYMVPTAFVPLPALPLSSSGKLDRQALPVPEVQGDKPYAGPRTPTETALAVLWADILQLPQVGIHDNFFEIGGHSLMAVQLGMRIREKIHPQFPHAEVYNRPSIAQLADWIDQESYAAKTLDLSEEIDLPEHIRSAELVPSLIPTRVFLTGASGFVGCYLLAALLRDTSASVVCHVRAADSAQGRKRLRRAMADRQLGNVWDDERIHVVTGDLGADRLGLEDSAVQLVRDGCDAIYHCAAQVDFMHPYTTLKGPNVDSLVTLLEWTAQGRAKSLHYVSTLAVIGQNEEGGTVTERSALASWNGLVDGYSQSKWVADGIARQAQARGLPVAIYRLGSVTGDHDNAICNAADLIWRVAHLYADLQAIPDVDLPLNMTPVDDVARAILGLAGQASSWGQVFHLMSPAPLRVRDIPPVFERLGLPLESVELERWLLRAHERLAEGQDRDLAALLAILDRYDASAKPPKISGAATHEQLAAIGAAIRPVDRDLLHRYFVDLGVDTKAQRALEPSIS
ncbi:SDR family oxidoreductase [Acidovorax sp. SUPP3334]|uniref:SDR family oxidoreductase n=1 Tax=Acidovorax sp. SUPP3334 TaxID=2920881 RepID=UPI0023DE52B0|nr:SDR family oxidoreductase [Acidovorax sp. SUPP3334]GKT26448.1 hypothetical protein AVHM3334_21045 [Acidovorax sp. SUPP3334]